MSGAMGVKGEGGGGMVWWTRGCSVHKSCGGLRTSTAADAGDVCSGGVKGWKGLPAAFEGEAGGM